MIDYKNKLNSIFILLEKCGRLLWKYLSFSLADNFFSIAKVVCISIEANGIYFVFGTKIFWKISIKYFKKFPLEEDKALTPEYLATVVSKALNEMGAIKASFVLCVPRAWTIVQVAEFPITVKENLANVISYELDRLTPLTPENAYYDYKIIAESQDKISVLLTVAKADRINPFLEALLSKNVKIEKLSISAFVINNLIKDTYNSKSSIFISVNDKAYECGAIINDFTVRSISGKIQSLDDSQINQIIRETFSLMDILTKSGKPAKIIINADEKYYKIFFDKLSKLPVFNLDRDNKLGLPKGNKDISSFALGCFLETVTADQNGFNLLADKNGNHKKTPFIATLVLLAVILLIGAFYVVSPIIIGQKSIEQIDDRISSLKPEMKKIEALKKEIETISSDIKTINNFKKYSILTIDILKEITTILPDKAWLTRVRVTDNSVEIEGYAASATAIIPKLENSKYFQKAEFASPTFRDPRQNNERFVIKMELKNENKPKKQEDAGVKNEKKK
jgi:general secretion pathway protein L